MIFGNLTYGFKNQNVNNTETYNTLQVSVLVVLFQPGLH